MNLPMLPLLMPSQLTLIECLEKAHRIAKTNTSDVNFTYDHIVFVVHPSTDINDLITEYFNIPDERYVNRNILSIILDESIDVFEPLSCDVVDKIAEDNIICNSIKNIIIGL